MHKITWTGPRAAMEAAATFFSEAYCSTAHAVALTKNDENAADDASNAWSLEVYFEEPPDIARLEDAIAAFDQSWRDVAPGRAENLPDVDWVAHSLEGLGIVRAGRFVLYGVHDRDRLPTNGRFIPIRIDANQAFGTGHHPTTAGCLTLLDRLDGLAPNRILDLGCGSGALAIAATKLWDRDALASDIDETSAQIAAENARLNGVGGRVRVVTAAGFGADAIRGAAPFDFVFANILAGPLVELAPEMAAHVARHGRVMLAGLMAGQEEAVEAAYAAAGFRRLNRLDHPVWPVLFYVRL